MESEAYSDDLFDRKKIADGLERFISSSSSSQIVAIDAPWGAGKTKFLSMWHDDLKKRGFLVVYFDAYQYDYFKDPFVPLCVELQRAARASGLTPSIIDSFTKASKGLASAALKGGLHALVRIVSMGTLGNAESEELQEVTSAAMKSAGERAAEEVFSNFEELSSTREAFSSALRSLNDDMSARESGNSELRLLFMIDELDRCRPEFCIELIECVKHFFQASRTSFIFGINLSQTMASIEATHGQNFDSFRYLSKFFDIIYSLDLKVGDGPDDYRSRFVDRISEDFDPPQELFRDFDEAVEELKRIAKSQRMSLRDIEKSFVIMKIFFSFAPKRLFHIGPITAGIAYLKACYPERLDQLRRDQIASELLLELLGLPDLGSSQDTDLRMSQLWIYLYRRGDLEIDVKVNIDRNFSRMRSHGDKGMINYLIESVLNAFAFAPQRK